MPRTDDQIINELRAENKALKIVMTAMRAKSHRQAAIIELATSDNKAVWTITCPWPVLEREIGIAVGQAIARDIRQGIRLVSLFFTGTSIEAQGADEIPIGETEPEP